MSSPRPKKWKCSQLPALSFFLLLAPAAATPNLLQQGCLYSKNLTSKIRVCNSEDPPEAEGSICRQPTVVYDELRIAPGNWDSANIETWVIQILLSEMLDVPTSIEMRAPNKPPISLYQPDSSLVFADTRNGYSYLENAFRWEGNCSQADRSSEETYEECAHVYPESWSGQDNAVVQELVHQGVVESPRSLGMISQNRWFVPLFTAERDPTLVGYRGLQGEKNRKKLAEMFKRPTTWKDYCDIVSSDGCATPDNVAERAPLDETENERMFVDNLYTGFFRDTDKNNCTANPDTCTGFIANYPCEWFSSLTLQLHTLDIALDVDVENGGNQISQLTEMWRAANWTKSNLIMMWWTPDVLPGEFLGTDADFIPISFPKPSLACLEARDGITYEQCDISADSLDNLSPVAACEDPPQILYKLMSTTIFDRVNDPAIADGIRAPTHAALSDFTFSELQLDEIFALTNKLGDPRHAVCEWVVENIDYLEELIPRSYPRVFEKKDTNALVYASTILGGAVASLTLLTLFLVNKHRNRRIIRMSQYEFLVMLLVGSFLIALGAIVIGAPSSDATCILEIWLVNIGYSLELVPLIVKVAAVNHMMSVGKKMRRVQIDRNFLFAAVAFICALVAIFLVIWTVLDPPMVMQEYQLTETTNEEGETLVWVFEVCGSKSRLWSYFSVGWNLMLLLCTSTLAFQMRKVKLRGFSETLMLALLVYSHFFFVILRVITYLLYKSVPEYVLANCRSFIFSLDTLATIVIYFRPKLLGKDIEGRSFMMSSTVQPALPVTSQFVKSTALSVAEWADEQGTSTNPLPATGLPRATSSDHVDRDEELRGKIESLEREVEQIPLLKLRIECLEMEVEDVPILKQRIAFLEGENAEEAPPLKQEIENLQNEPPPKQEESPPI